MAALLVVDNISNLPIIEEIIDPTTADKVALLSILIALIGGFIGYSAFTEYIRSLLRPRITHIL